MSVVRVDYDSIGGNYFTDTQTVVDGSTNTFALPFVPKTITLLYIDSGNSTHFVVDEFVNVGTAEQYRYNFYANSGYAESGEVADTTTLTLNGTSVTFSHTNGWGMNGKTVRIIAS